MGTNPPTQKCLDNILSDNIESIDSIMKIQKRISQIDATTMLEVELLGKASKSLLQANESIYEYIRCINNK